MSFNPTRLAPNKSLHRPTAPPVGAGTTHSAIMNKYVGTSFVPAGEKKPTPFGYYISLFSNDQFSTRFEVMHSKTGTGLGVNASADRTFLVVKGAVFVTVEVSGNQEILKIAAGNCFHAPKNTVHGISTSGTEGAELHIVETTDYSKNWKQLSAPVIGDVVVNDTPHVHQPQVIRRGPDPRTVAQAQELAAQAETRRRMPVEKKAPKQASNANSANVLGANPRPMGPPVEE